jgi:hypothetical protein
MVRARREGDAGGRGRGGRSGARGTQRERGGRSGSGAYYGGSTGRRKCLPWEDAGAGWERRGLEGLGERLAA